MKKLTLLSTAYLLASGIASASSLPCSGFKVIIKNNLEERIVSTKVKTDNAEITPTLATIDKHREQTFIIFPSTEDKVMHGNFIFKTISTQPKNIHIEFDLKNKISLSHCSHTPQDIPNAFPVSHKRSRGTITYTIGKK